MIARKMKTRQLGNSGLLVSEIGLGCMSFGVWSDFEATSAVVHAALDHGITLFDTADVYGFQGQSETFLGDILGTRRKDIVLATKFGLPMNNAHRERDASRRYIVSAVEASLRRLKTDWIDLYQLHRPDPATPMEETLRALDDLIHDGKVRYIGVSNLAGWQLVDADWTARSAGINRFIAHQDEYSLLNRAIEAEIIPAGRALGIGLLPYFPLASGLLTGKHISGRPVSGSRLDLSAPLSNRFLTDANLCAVDQLIVFCTQRGHSLLELAFSWLLAKGSASIIAGASNPAQIAQNVQAGNWSLTDADLAEVDFILTSLPRS